MVRRYVLLLWLWLLPLLAQAAVLAQLERNPVALGDPVVLSFTADSILNTEPDFSPLLQDFDLAGTAQSSSFSSVNGIQTQTTVWELTLYPKRSGTLTIPPIAFGNASSQSLDLQVTEQPAPQAAGTVADVLVELEVEPKQPFVQQETIVTQRLLHAAPLAPQASLSHPQIAAGKGTIQQIGATRHTTMLRDGRNYQVIERRYALIPQQSGALTLGRTVFEGALADAGKRRDFDPFGLGGKPIQRVSKPLTLQVQGQPAGYTGKYWLPARSLTLNAYWEKPTDKLKAGEPVTLTLGIVAAGLAAEQLPNLAVNVPNGIKAYTDKPELRNDASNQGVVGLRQEKWVVVVPYNGEYTFPAITLDWWNTQTGKQETARLEPTKLIASGGQVAPVAPSATAPMPQAKQPATEPSTAANNAVAATSVGETVWYVRLLLIVIGLGLSWLIWLGWQRLHLRNPQPAQPSLAALQKRLQQACEQNQPQQAHDALLAWVAAAGIRPALLTTLYAQATPELRRELDALNAALYGRSNSGWQGTGLWAALQAFAQQGQQQSEKVLDLAPLYPS